MCKTGGKRCATSTRASYQDASNAARQATAAESTARNQIQLSLAAGNGQEMNERERETARTRTADQIHDLDNRMRTCAQTEKVLTEARIQHAMTPKGRKEVSSELEEARSADVPHGPQHALERALRTADGRNADLAKMEAMGPARAAAVLKGKHAAAVEAARNAESFENATKKRSRNARFVSILPAFSS